MCRCFNGGCSQNNCECKAQGKKCTDCWCVLCSNRDQETESPLIILEQQVITYAPPRASQYANPSLNTYLSSINFSNKQEYYCGCGVSKCSSGNCGCQKRKQKCKAGCRCPPDCRNYKQLQSMRSEPTESRVISQPSGNNTDSPFMGLYRSSSSPQEQSNLFHPNTQPVQPNFNPIVQLPPAPISNAPAPKQLISSNPSIFSFSTILKHPQPNTISQPTHNDLFNNKIQQQTATKLKIIEKKQQVESSLNLCCKCIQCNKSCPCFREGECCTQCFRKDCLNLELKEQDVYIPNYIRS